MIQRLKQNRRTYEYICANLLPLFSTTPILIYQMGRGGSSSLRNALMRCQEPETNLVFHFHDFFPIRKMDPNALPIDEMYRGSMRQEILHANGHGNSMRLCASSTRAPNNTMSDAARTRRYGSLRRAL